MNAPSQAKQPALPPALGTPYRQGEFQPLFNGRNLSGWKSHRNQPGDWRAVNGVLIGSGPALSHLYTERDNFKDFHLYVGGSFNRGGSGGVYIRCPFGPSLPADNPKWPDGFEATINNARVVRNSTGGIYPGVGNDVFITDFTRVPFGDWFTLDVIVEGNAIAVLVNGQSSGYHVDKKGLFSSGHIALQQYSPKTVIEFRKIEIMELNLSNQKDLKEIRALSHGPSHPGGLLAGRTRHPLRGIPQRTLA